MPFPRFASGGRPSVIHQGGNMEASGMNERVRFITHRGKQILLVDLSNCSAAQVDKLVRQVPEVVTAQARASVLILSDYTGAEVDKEAIRTIEQSAVFDKPFVKRSAWVGAEHFPEVFRKNLKSFSGREFPIFKTREDAVEWLTAE